MFFPHAGILALALTALIPRLGAGEDQGPAISITSPDKATTFAFGSIKQHQLYWDRQKQELIVQVVFEDVNQAGGIANDDVLAFSLPGIRFNPDLGYFYATTAAGEKIPVATYRRQFFVKSVVALPNAVIRIQHPRGVVKVILEALRPDDPALKALSPAVAHPEITP